MTIAEYRTKHGLSSRAFAKLVGVPHTTASAWEEGHRPGLTSLQKIKRATDGAVTEDDWPTRSRATSRKRRSSKRRRRSASPSSAPSPAEDGAAEPGL